jgi:hypothetical protein
MKSNRCPNCGAEANALDYTDPLYEYVDYDCGSTYLFAYKEINFKKRNFNRKVDMFWPELVTCEKRLRKR